ncbi:MAG: hypothetical protein IKJ13_07725 [Clostridia bacterium]|nr:hypothetical protein [Clostridia bacterium]
MKITKTLVLVAGDVVRLPSEETLIIKAVYREPDGRCYKVQFVEDDGEEYVNVGDERVMAHYELVGGEV